MPPGQALLEVLFGRSGSKLARHKGPSLRGASRQSARQEAQQHAFHATHQAHSGAHHAASAAAPGLGSGRLVQFVVDVFAPLVRPPGGAVNTASARRAALNDAQGLNGSGRRLLLHRAAGLHTAARPHGVGGFGNLKPSSIPRSTNQVGLGSARNFSSSRTVFENVVHNAPLGLRVFGDDDLLDMRSLKRQMKQAYIKQQKQEAAQGKGKGRLGHANMPVPAFPQYTAQAPAHFDDYFPVDAQAYAVNKPSVQLVLPLAPTQDKAQFLSVNEEAAESRFFSAMLMSDLRLLHDIYGRHHARMRNIISRLESAGCFEVDDFTGQSSVRAVLDEARGCIVVTFYGERWCMADVRQVLGYYQTGPTPWFDLIDLSDASTTASADEVESLPSSLPSEFGDEVLSRPNSRVFFNDSVPDDPTEYDRITQSLQMPTLSAVTEGSHTNHPILADSYLSGVEGFLSDIETSRKPTFV